MRPIAYQEVVRAALVDDGGEQVVDWLQVGPAALRVAERYRICGQYSWAIPTEDALTVIAALGPVVEVGAGTGYWAMLLRERGMDVVAYDQHPPAVGAQDNHWHQNVPTWTAVLAGPAEVAADHPDRTLLLCWPPMGYMAGRALAAYTGGTVVYVGEPAGNCTAGDDFFARLAREWLAVGEVKIWRWYGCTDRVTVYTRLSLSQANGGK